MKRKYKMTGCARLLLFLVVFAPLAYLGASYYNGEDGIQKIKMLLGIDGKAQKSDDYDIKDELERLREENEMLKARIRELKSEKEGD